MAKQIVIESPVLQQRKGWLEGNSRFMCVRPFRLRLALHRRRLRGVVIQASRTQWADGSGQCGTVSPGGHRLGLRYKDELSGEYLCPPAAEHFAALLPKSQTWTRPITIYWRVLYEE